MQRGQLASSHRTLRECLSHVCSRPKGFGFVEYCDPRDAEEALYGMDGKNFGGRDIAVSLPKMLQAINCCG